MRVTEYRFLAVLACLGLAVWLFLPWAEIVRWAATEQREFQNAMARGLRGLRDGDPFALLGLCAATAAYGVVHAVGPGHGKVLLGGAALASGASFRRLALLTLLSSLAQSATAILLVGALVFGASLGAGDAANLIETWLVPISTAAIAAIGASLIWRGLRAMQRSQARPEPHSSHDHDHEHDHGTCGCGHTHGPSVESVRSLQTSREAIALVASIALRPCTGALFVLVISARFDVFAAGCIAVLAMGLGTSATNLCVAGGGRLARRLAFIGADTGSVRALRVSALLHMMGGTLILCLSLAFLWPRIFL